MGRLRWLDVFNWVVSTRIPRDQPQTDALVNQVAASKYLLSLFVVDTLSWVVGRIVQFEAATLIVEYSNEETTLVFVLLVLNTVEVLVEFVAALVSPRVYYHLAKTDVFSCRQLARAAMRVFLLSNILAAVLYPPLAGAIYLFLPQGYHLGLAYLLAVLLALQYSFLNQLGDSLVEMSLPHWMETFNGLQLLFPGVGCCRGRMHIAREATAKGLSVYVQVSRFCLSVSLTIVYLIVEEYVVARWAILLVATLLNVVVGVLCWRNDQVLNGVVEPATGGVVSHAMVPLTELHGYEFALIVFFVFIIIGPESAQLALFSVLVTRTSSPIQLGAIVGGTMLGFLYLVRCLRRLSGKVNSSPSRQVEEEEQASCQVVEEEQASRQVEEEQASRQVAESQVSRQVEEEQASRQVAESQVSNQPISGVPGEAHVAEARQMSVDLNKHDNTFMTRQSSVDPDIRCLPSAEVTTSNEELADTRFSFRDQSVDDQAPKLARNNAPTCCCGVQREGTHWVRLMWFVLILLSLAYAVLLTVPSKYAGATIVMALILLRPPLIQLRIGYDTVLIKHEPRRGTSVAFYANVAGVVVNAPLLAINWYTMRKSFQLSEQAMDAELLHAGFVSAVTGTMMLGTTLYFTLWDPKQPASRSLFRFLDSIHSQTRVTKSILVDDTEAEQPTVDRIVVV